MPERASITFYDFYALNTGVNAHYVETFRLNDPRDPQYAVGGGSPSLFAQLDAFWLKYRVESVDFDVHGYSNSAEAVSVGVVFRGPNDAAPANGVEAQQLLRERPNLSVVDDCPPYAAGDGFPRFHLRGHRSMTSIAGKVAITDEDFASTFTGDPVSGIFMDLILVAANGSSDAMTADAHVTITYHMRLYEPKLTYTD